MITAPRPKDMVSLDKVLEIILKKELFKRGKKNKVEMGPLLGITWKKVETFSFHFIAITST